MTQSFRLENVGLINREKKISFKFNGKTYHGFEGDTLASALIANGIHLIGRSLFSNKKYIFYDYWSWPKFERIIKFISEINYRNELFN